MSFGENFLLMDVEPTTYSKKVEKETNSNGMNFYFSNIKFFEEDWRVYFVGTASNSSYDGGVS